MFQTLKNAWKDQELRGKILFTLWIIIIYRIGVHIPVPYVDVKALFAALNTTGTGGAAAAMDYLTTFTGGAMRYGSVFSMGVNPYITASIVIQLLTVAIPALERLSKEGEEGRKQITKITRYTTIVLGIIQGTAFFFYLKNSSFLLVNGKGAIVMAAVVMIACFTAGSVVMMWLGEQIDKKGVGNGISMLLFAGILSRATSAFSELKTALNNNEVIQVVTIVIVMLAVIVFIVFVTTAEHRIPIQYAKRVVGRKMMGGSNSFIPIKVNMSGVMPIIFASSILMVPTAILGFMTQFGHTPDSRLAKIFSFVSTRSATYGVLIVILIVAFSYFYQTIQYNPQEMANNLRKNNGSVPGIRPGKPTSDYIAKVLSKVTFVGAIFLGIVALLPIITGGLTGIQISLGGTTILIIVAVAIDFVNQLESQMMMRHYKGFLD